MRYTEEMMLQSKSGFCMPFEERGKDVELTLGYGKQKHPITGTVFFHHGLDFEANHYLLSALASGTVSGIGNDATHGIYQVIRYGKYEVTYAHLANVFVNFGQTVKAGNVVALSGDRLHFEVKFDGKEMDAFRRKGCKSKLDKTLICTSLGGGLAALMGTTPCTTFIESITGILSGGRTGLTACVTGLMFLGCLPLANFFNSIPSAAGAPALIIAGSFMLPLVHRIDWRNFEESCPSFLTLLFLPVSGSIFGGVIAGVMGHIIIQIFMGKWRSVHPLLYAASILFIVILLAGGPNI